MTAEQLAAAQVLERLADHFPGRTARGRQVQALRRAAEALRTDQGTTGALAAVQAAYEAPRGR
jgi:hypothetical protein